MVGQVPEPDRSFFSSIHSIAKEGFRIIINTQRVAGTAVERAQSEVREKRNIEKCRAVKTETAHLEPATVTLSVWLVDNMQASEIAGAANIDLAVRGKLQLIEIADMGR